MSWREKIFVGVAAASLLIATMLGAYASHGLQDVSAQTLNAVRTAVDYQFYHGLALLLVPVLGERLGRRWFAAAGWLFVAGTLLFCGGIYVSSLLEWSPAGRAAPLGGIAFITGWTVMLVAACKPSRERRP